MHPEPLAPKPGCDKGVEGTEHDRQRARHHHGHEDASLRLQLGQPLLYRNVQWFRSGLVFKTFVSLNSGLVSNNEDEKKHDQWT